MHESNTYIFSFCIFIFFLFCIFLRSFLSFFVQHCTLKRFQDEPSSCPSFILKSVSKNVGKARHRSGHLSSTDSFKCNISWGQTLGHTRTIDLNSWKNYGLLCIQLHLSVENLVIKIFQRFFHPVIGNSNNGFKSIKGPWELSAVWLDIFKASDKVIKSFFTTTTRRDHLARVDPRLFHRTL